MNQLERYEILEAKAKDYSWDMTKPHNQLWKKKLEILRKNPEYMDKLGHFEKADAYMTSSRDIIIFLELDVVEQ